MGAESYPTLGLAFDLGEIASAQGQIDALKGSYLELGAAAQKAAQDASAASSASRVAAASTTGGGGGSGAATAAAQAGAAAQSAAIAQSVAATEAAAARMVALYQGIATSEVAAAKAGADGAAAAQATGVAAQVAEIAKLAAAQTSASVSAALAAADAATDMTAITAGRVDKEVASEAIIGVYRMSARQKEAADQAAAAAEMAAATAARVQSEIASEELLDVYILESQQRRAAAAAAANAAEVADHAAALAEEEAAEELYVTFVMGARTQMFAQTAASKAEEVAAAEAAAAEQMAIEEHLDAFIANSRGVAVRASLAAYTEQTAAAQAAASAQQAIAETENAFIDKVNSLAGALGKTRSALLAEQAATMGLTAETSTSIAAIAKSEQALNNLGGAGGFSARAIRELVVIIREFSRGDFSRLAGSASIELQAVGALGAVISALPWIAAAAGAVTFAVAIDRGQEQLAKFNNALQLTSQFTGLTASQLDALGHSIGGETSTSIGKADQALLSLVQSGKVSGDAIASVGEAATIMSRLTGESASKVASSYAQMFEDPVKGAKQLEDSYHFLTLAQYEEIEALQKQGDKQGAAVQMFKDLDTWAKNQTVSMGYLEQALHGVTTWFGNVWQAMKDVGKQDPAAQLAADMSQLQTLQSGGAVGMAGGGRAAAIKSEQEEITKLQAQLSKQRADSAKAQSDTAKITEHQDAEALLTELKGNAQQLKDDYARIDKGIAAGEINPNDRTALRAAAAKRDDKIDHPTVRAGRDPATELGKGADAITALSSEIDALASGNQLDEVSAKMIKAANDARVTADNGGAKKAAAADQLANNAAVKEGLTETLTYMDALNKETVAHREKINALNAESAAQQASTAIMMAYYASSDHSPTAFADALKAQDAAQLKATDSMSELDIAQKFHVTSIDQISAAMQKELEAGGMSTEMAKKRGDQVQASAKADLDAADAVNAKTLALANEKKADDALVAGASAITYQQDLTKAYVAGYDALVALNRQTAINAEEKTGGKDMTTAGATNIVDQTAANTALATETKITYELNLQSTLATQTSVDRINSARTEQAVTDLINEGQAKGITYTRQQVLAQAQVTAELERQVQESNQLKTSIEDSIRDGFASTGNLDFSTFTKAIETAIRKSVYDSLLAKPIDVAINAAVNSITGPGGALSSLFGSGGSGGLLSGLTSLFGGASSATGNAGLATSVRTGIDEDLGGSLTSLAGSGQTTNTQLGGIGASLKSLPSDLGTVFAGFTVGSAIGGAASSALGITQNSTDASIGGALGAAVGLAIPIPGASLIFGALGNFIGGLLGPKPSNYAADAQFDAQGNVSRLYGDKPNATTSGAVSSVAGGVASAISTLAGYGIDSAGIISSIEIGQRDTSKININGEPTMQTAVGDTTALTEGIEKALLQYGKYSDPKEQALVEQMIAANESFSTISTTLQNYIAAQQLVTGIANDNEQYVDPQAYQLQQLQATQLQRREAVQQDADEGLLSPDQLASINAELTILEKSEIGSTVAQFATTVGGATQSIADYTAAQTKLATYLNTLMTGTLSPLSPQAQLQEDQQAYQTDLTGAQGGNLTNLSDISTTADAYLQAAQKYYGSSAGYTSIFGSVANQLSGLTTASATDPNAAAVAAAQAALQAAEKAAGTGTLQTTPAAQAAAAAAAASTTTPDPTTVALLQSINAALVALNAQVASGSDAQVSATSAAASQVSTATSGAVLTTTALQGGLITKATGLSSTLKAA